jgi:hypothetical protein
MKHADKPIHLNALARAKQIHLARAAGSAKAAEIESAVASAILGRPVDPTSRCQGGLRPFEAAESVAAALTGVMAGFASKDERKAPLATSYSPFYASPSTFRAIWKLREVADELGIPYDLYIFIAAEFLDRATRVRAPRPNRFCAPDVVDYVIAAWAARGAGEGEADDVVLANQQG